MIRDVDAEFHAPETDKLDWAETNYFGFYNAEEKLNIGVYALFRTNLRTVNSTICMNSGFVTAPWHADYVDWQASIPMPENCSLLDYKLSNGLEVRCLVPNQVWEVRFNDGAGTSIDVTFKAIMPAFDIHDPDMDPMVKAPATGEFSWGTAYNGHFDLTGHVTGEVILRGRHIPIDCISTMDHSWGPRPERGSPTMSWLHAHFSKDLAVHAIFSFDPAEKEGELALTHGYVVENGKVFGFKAGRGRTLRSCERYADEVELELTGSDGRVWKLTGKGLTTFPWQCYANMVGHNVLARWEMNGQTGYGEIQDFVEYAQLTELNSNPATRAVVTG